MHSVSLGDSASAPICSNLMMTDKASIYEYSRISKDDFSNFFHLWLAVCGSILQLCSIKPVVTGYPRMVRQEPSLMK